MRVLATAYWSSGQDAALSRRKQGFDSPTGYQKMNLEIREIAVFMQFHGFLLCLENRTDFLGNQKSNQNQKIIIYLKFINLHRIKNFYSHFCIKLFDAA